MAKEVLPFLPGLQLFSRQRLDKEKRIKALRVPILFIHGKRDRIVPVSHGRRMYELAPEPKTYLEIASAGHDDCYISGRKDYRDAWNKFILSTGNEPTRSRQTPN